MAQCTTPYHVKNTMPTVYDGWHIPVPCGKCPECLTRRADGWIFRLKREIPLSKTAFFVTLTYSPTHCPVSDKGMPTLRMRDFQLFMKRLRKAHREHSLSKIKYYVCGEYGSITERPHYHAIIFNANENDIVNSWRIGNEPIGHIDIKAVNSNNIAYTVGYVHKGKIIPKFKGDDRERERSFMSKGLGIDYVNDKMIRYHQNNPMAMYLTVEQGKKIAMPRYYKQKLYTDEHRDMQAKYFKKLGQKSMQKSENEYIMKHGTIDGYVREREARRAENIKNHRAKYSKKRGL